MESMNLDEAFASFESILNTIKHDRVIHDSLAEQNQQLMNRFISVCENLVKTYNGNQASNEQIRGYQHEELPAPQNQLEEEEEDQFFYLQFEKNPTLFKNKLIMDAIRELREHLIADFQKHYNLSEDHVFGVLATFFSVDLEEIGLVRVYAVCGIPPSLENIVIKVKITDVHNVLDVFNVCNSKYANPRFRIYDDVEYLNFKETARYYNIFNFLKLIKRLTPIEYGDIMFAVRPP